MDWILGGLVVGLQLSPLIGQLSIGFQEEVWDPPVLPMSTHRECGSYIPVQQLEEMVCVLEWDEQCYCYGILYHVNDAHKFS